MNPIDADSVIKVTKSQKSALLRHYADLNGKISPAGDCLIGSGYTACLDIGFMAVDLFNAIQPEIIAL